MFFFGKTFIAQNVIWKLFSLNILVQIPGSSTTSCRIPQFFRLWFYRHSSLENVRRRSYLSFCFVCFGLRFLFCRGVRGWTFLLFFNCIESFGFQFILLRFCLLKFNIVQLVLLSILYLEALAESTFYKNRLIFLLSLFLLALSSWILETYFIVFLFEMSGNKSKKC